MILHVPTITRWTRGAIYFVVISYLIWKLGGVLWPVLKPDEPYRIPAGDALSVHARVTPESPSVGSHHFIKNKLDAAEWWNRLKVFYETGE